MIWENKTTGKLAQFVPDANGNVLVSVELMDKLLTELGFEEQK